MGGALCLMIYMLVTSQLSCHPQSIGLSIQRPDAIWQLCHTCTSDVQYPKSTQEELRVARPLGASPPGSQVTCYQQPGKQGVSWAGTLQCCSAAGKSGGAGAGDPGGSVAPGWRPRPEGSSQLDTRQLGLRRLQKKTGTA